MSESLDADAGEILMPFEPDRCPLTAALRVIGGKWKAALWWRLSLGIGRFLQLQRSVSQISKKMLAQELRDLERDGIVQRRAVPGSLPTVEYSLTDYGRTLAPVMEVLCAWGEHHRQRNVAGRGAVGEAGGRRNWWRVGESNP